MTKLYKLSSTEDTYLVYNGTRIEIPTYPLSCGDPQVCELQKTQPHRIIFNGPACIVIWGDGTKTIVKKMGNEEWDPYAAVAQALAKKVYGSTSAFHNLVDDLSKYQYPQTEEGCYV